jgi:hypothetical protein
MAKLSHCNKRLQNQRVTFRFGISLLSDGKSLGGCALVAAALCVPTFGLTFKGSFTYTISTLNRPADGIEVGDSFEGHYAYESDTVDGTFSGAPGTLTGDIFIPYPLNPRGADGFEALERTGFSLPVLTVNGGVVTDFFWHPTMGPLELNMDFDTMSFSRDIPSDNRDLSLRGTATVSFTRPEVSVPESGYTAPLLLLGLACLGFVRVRKPTAESACFSHSPRVRRNCL